MSRVHSEISHPNCIKISSIVLKLLWLLFFCGQCRLLWHRSAYYIEAIFRHCEVYNMTYYHCSIQQCFQSESFVWYMFMCEWNARLWVFEMSVVSHVLESLYCQYLPVSDGKWKDLRHLNRSIKRNILFTRVHTHFYVDCCLINSGELLYKLF